MRLQEPSKFGVSIRRGILGMREQKRKNRVSAAGDRIKGVRHDEIMGDVFELWIGIARLMARMRGSDQPLESSPGPKRPSARKSPAT